MSLENDAQQKAIDNVYQAHLTLHSIQGGGAMSPTTKEVEAAIKIMEEAAPYVREQALIKFEGVLKPLWRRD